MVGWLDGLMGEWLVDWMVGWIGVLMGEWLDGRK
jgi:hypothetical protein